MKHIFITFLTFCIFHQTYSQDIDRQTLNYLVRIWGEVADKGSEHHGKGGLVLLKLNQDKTFAAYENTDFGASILQVGSWTQKEKSITFFVTETRLARKEKEYFMKGRILDLDKGEITYNILELEDNKFIIKAQNSGKTLIFKQTNFVYFPKETQ